MENYAVAVTFPLPKHWWRETVVMLIHSRQCAKTTVEKWASQNEIPFEECEYAVFKLVKVL